MFNYFEAYRKYLSYTLSLPERTIRALASLVGGVSLLLTHTFFPQSLRGSTTYRIFVGNLQRFIVEKIAQMPLAQEVGQNPSNVSNDYLQRKVVGTALEAAGLLTLHFSPVWVFAVAGDVVGGSKVFLNELVDQLKKNGVIAEETRITTLTDLLDAMQQATSKSAVIVDTPPLSRRELGHLSNEIMTSYRRVFAGTTNLLPRMENVWRQMRAFSAREQISLERLEGIMTIDLARLAQKSVGTMFAISQAGGGLVGETVLESYIVTLDTITKDGVEAYLDKHLDPFFRAAVQHFSPHKTSWTETLFTPKPSDDVDLSGPG